MTIPKRRLKRGMWIRYPDGTIEQVAFTSRFPHHIYWKRGGPRIYQSDKYIYAYVHHTDFEILGFLPERRRPRHNRHKSRTISRAARK